jgi:preprotein translocase SecE subunit
VVRRRVAQCGGMNNHRYILMVFLAGSAVLGFTCHSVAVDVLARMDTGDPVLAGISLSAGVSLVTALVTFFVLLRHERAYLYTDEVVGELRKVTWPVREETVRSTAVVLGFTAVMASSLALYDYLWATVTGIVLFNES